MSGFRLPADAPNGLGGSAIDRGRVVRFRLNGRKLEGILGDTVLSAALAAGIVSAGRHGDDPLALDMRFAPSISLAGGAPLPMERTPALDGLDYFTLGARRDPIASTGPIGALRNMLLGPARTLNHRFGAETANAPAWASRAPDETISTDLVIVGGGIAGLTAANAASAAGRKVVLVERLPGLGGNAAFFGAVEGEAPPEAVVAQLAATLGQRPGVRLITGAEAVGAAAGRVDAHIVEIADGRPRSRTLRIEAPQVLIATGAIERLPVFPGNRTPGVVGTLAAWQRAVHYGLWPGRRSVFSAPHSFVYRLALRAKDAGVAVLRVADTRLGPQSRFIDFCKATGITLASGLIVSQAAPLRRNTPGVRVQFAVAIDDIVQDATPIEADALIAGGGFQPDLALWLTAGGAARWDAQNQWLVPAGSRDGIAVIGSAAGWHSTAAVVESAKAAVSALLGKPAPAPVDRVIDSAFETPDAGTPLAPYREAARGPAAFLDAGPSFVTRRTAAAGRHGVSLLAAEARAITLSDVAAAVQAGSVPPSDVGAVVAERCTLGHDIADSGWRPAAPAPPDGMPEPPAYLAGRFGPKPLVAVLSVADSRVFEPGCLVFETSTATDPLAAIGVVFATAPGNRSGGLALVSRLPEALDATLHVRDSSGAVPVKVLERLKPRK